MAPPAPADDESEQVLGGGFSNDGFVVRIGETVHRPAGPHTEAVHRFLHHLRSCGIDFVPEPIGFDDQGREVLSFIEGDVAVEPYPAWMSDPDLLRDVARHQAALHRAAATFDAPDGVAWAEAAGDYFPTGSDGGLVCHNDLGVINVVVRDRRVAGFIDFDFARPVNRLFDIAVAARHWVPFAPPRWRPDATRDVDAVERFAIFCDEHALDRTQRSEVLDLIRAFVDQAGRNVVALAHTTRPGLMRLLEKGYEEAIAATLVWIDATRPSFDRP